jgi:hypothetical protein
MSAKYPVITICGSMRYFPQMLNHAEQLTTNGNIVLMGFNSTYLGGKIADDVKIMLDDMHKHKIDMSDYVHIIGDHIGQSTRDEIRYATEKGVPVTYYDDNIQMLLTREVP